MLSCPRYAKPIAVATALLIGIADATNAQTQIEPLATAPYQPGAYGSNAVPYTVPTPAPTNPPPAQGGSYILPSDTSGYPTTVPTQAPTAYPTTTGLPPGYPSAGTTVGYPQAPPVAVGNGYPVGAAPLPVPAPPAQQNVVPPPITGQPIASPSSMPSELAALPTEVFEPEPIRQWYHYPWAWIPRDGWDNSIEFGLNGAEGNTRSLSYVAGADFMRKSDIYNFTANLDYRRTQSGNLETQNNARLNVDLDRAIAESKFASFVKGGLEYDEFKAFDLRINVNGGLSYIWSKTDDLTFITRFGGGASQELGSVDETWKPEALFGLETSHQLNSRNKIYSKVDYFPAWEDFSDYRLVTDAGWEILLSGEENFSLKLSALNRLDSTPLGRKPRDIDYAATLLYKF